MSSPSPRKTLVFCTAYAQSRELWDRRYRVWLDAILRSQLRHDQILIVDDGSPVLPDWPDLAITGETMPMRPEAPVALFHFRDNLGRPRDTYFPGWLRSFFFAAAYARLFGFDKIVHIESDAFLITPRVQAYFNSVTEGWVALWCPRYKMPESGLQIIAGNAIERCAAFGRRSFDTPDADVIEKMLPFTHVETGFNGDRYGEYQDHIPRDADYVMQIKATRYADPDYLWWLPQLSPLAQPRPEPPAPPQAPPPAPAAAPASPPAAGYAHPAVKAHPGVDYKRLLAAMNQVLAPRAYFEIGTNEGSSLAQMTCDAVCVDPHFHLSGNPARGRRRTLLFQCSSDDFFHENRLRAFFPGGVDIAFLDGLHRFEVLLRDFINTERECNPRSVILLHDCLPINARMAERVQREDPAESPATRNFWTGDVWRLAPILKAYRPDLTIRYLDCPPTGLVAITGLDPRSDVLAHNYARIVEEYAALDLAAYGFDTLFGLFPMLDSAPLVADPAALTAEFALR
ncbi:MAG: class I SAM-dependent methyltransferase [Proteobacteria bacterium]|nr:class I SAM-dependent methyltransferase [Pseudomonadota bacterium]